MKMAKAMKYDGGAVTCAVCGKAIPPNPANGVATDCVWLNDHYECMECRNKSGKIPAANDGGAKVQSRKASPPEPAPSAPKPPKPEPKKPSGWDW